MSTLPLAPASEALAPAASARQRLSWAGLKGKVTGRVGYAVGDQVVYSFGNMVVAAMLSRHCAQRQFGIYILTQRTMDVLIQLCNVCLWAPFTFNYPGTTETERPRYMGSIVALQVAFCIVFTGVVWIAARWAGHAGRQDFVQTFTPLVFAGAGILFREFTRRMYFALLRMEEAFWTDVATVSLQIAGVVWLQISGRLSVSNTLLVLCAGAVVVSAWWVFRDLRRIRITAQAVWCDLKLNLQLGRWFLGSNMIFLASSQCNPWVLGSLLGGASVGAYAICESVVNIPRVALTSMQNVIGPMVARAQAEEGRPAVRKAVQQLDRKLLLGSLVLAFLMIAVGPSVAELVFKNVPPHSRLVLALLSLNLVFYAATLSQSYGLTAVGRADLTVVANGLGLLAQAAVCFLLVHSFGVSGAAAAMLLGTVVVLISRQVLYTREMRSA